MKKILSAIYLCILICGLTAKAQDDKPIRVVTSSYYMEIGKARIADTYLTPLFYDGSQYAFHYERSQPMRLDPRKWIMQLKLGFTFDDTKNPVRTATLLRGSLHGAWHMMRRWAAAEGLTIGAGAGTSLNLGALYMARNSNNPASAEVSWMLDATAYACWSAKCGPLKFTLRYQPTLPVVGTFFSPAYDQLYYQIYMGETKDLMHPAFFHNYFSMDNLLTADLHFGNTSLRIGYHNTILSTKVNFTVTRNVTHGLLIGVTTNWISLRPDSRKIDSSIISAY